jgi:TolB-like protein/Tfp pilus assembly protein PilF
MGVLKKAQKISKKNPTKGKPQATSKSAPRVFQFGSFCLDETDRVLFDDGKLVSLTPKAFDLLLVLVGNAGHLVTKDRLLKEVWPDAFVEEANLSVTIATLRKALRDRADEDQKIETVSKHGYRFVAKLVEVERKPPLRVEAQEPIASLSGHRGLHHPVANSLAVLPFDNESANPDAEYLSDGLTESIINRIAQLRGLKVVPRNAVFRFKAKNVDPRQVGQQLGVASVLSGRILQLGESLIVRTELIDVRNGWQIWGEQYHGNLSDILAVQEEISAAISGKLRVKLTREEKERWGRRYTEDAEAFRLYLKGRYYWNKYTETGLRKAIDYFEQAIEIDPTYAVAYAGLADSYYRLSNIYESTSEAMPKARAAATRALQIDQTLSEGHASLGLVKLFYEWDWSGAAVAFSRAIESDTKNALAHQRFALYFNLLGRTDEALRQIRLAAALDPLSSQINSGFAVTFFLAREYQRAMEEVRKTLEMDGTYEPALFLLGRIYEQRGQHPESIAAFEKALALNDAPMFRAGLGRALALAGQRKSALKVLNDLEGQSGQRYVSGYNKAVIHLALGDQDRAFSCLEQAYDERCEMMTWVKVDPHFDQIRADPRFANLLHRVGLDREYDVRPTRAANA